MSPHDYIIIALHSSVAVICAYIIYAIITDP